MRGIHLANRKEKLKIVKKRFGGKEYRFRVFQLTRGRDDVPPPIPAILGSSQETWNLFKYEIADFQSVVGPQYVETPFAFPYVNNRRFGDFTSEAGQREFRQTRLQIVADFSLSRAMQDLRRFADLAQVIRFSKSEECACVRDLKIVNGYPTFAIGQAPYEEVFATMNSQGLRFEVCEKQLVAVDVLRGASSAKELKTLSEKLRGQYGEVTIRKAVHDHIGGLPRFGDRVASYLLGNASLVLTSDKYVVFGRRAKKKVSVNVGISVPTAGGCVFNRSSLERLGFSRFVESEILREAEEELNIKGSDCSVTVLSLVRELARAGSPEVLAMIEFFGTLRDLVHRIRTNPNPDQDIDAVYAVPLNQARALATEKDAKHSFQSKALAALVMMDRYFKNSPA